MRTWIKFCCAAALVAACGGGGGTPSDPAAITDCGTLADAGIDLLDQTIDLIDSLDAADLAALASEEDAPPEFAALEQKGTALEDRAADLGCSPEEMSRLMADRVGNLSSDTVFGQFLIESVRSGEGGFFGG
jgi:hypothetical protein